jgi:exosortase A
MSTHLPAAPAPSLRETWNAIRSPLPALAVGLALMAIAFHGEAAAAYQVWMESTAYSHCFFVIPIAVYLAWERRQTLAGIPIVPVAWVVLAAIPLGIAWLGAERLGIMEGRQLVAMTMLQVLFLAVLGWRMYYGMAAPLLYLYFLVPFGAFITGTLQDFTAAFIDVGLNFLDIPHYSDAYIIEIPQGRFYVAEACAGLRFLIASIAFGVLYAFLMYRSPWRRVGFVLASIAIPIIANGFRALGIVLLGYLLGSAEAAATDHILYGWIFFSIVILLLIAAGLPFRQELMAPGAPPTPAPPMPPGRRPFVAAGILGIVALAGPTATGILDRRADIPLAAPAFTWIAPLGCRPEPSRPNSTSSGIAVTTFACPQGRLTASIQVLSPRANPAWIFRAVRQSSGEIGAEDSTSSSLNLPGPTPLAWRFITTSEPARATALALWINNAPARGGLAGRLVLARNSLVGTTHAPVLIAVSYQSPHPQIGPEEEQLVRLFITTFLQVQTTLSAQVAAIGEAAAGK